MHPRLNVVLRNLALFYLGLMLIMAAWGATSSAMKERSWPVTAAPASDASPTFLEMLGLWRPGFAGYHRLLRLGLPLRVARPRRLT